MFLLGISGWARSGKDTAGDFLVEKRGFTKVSFAKELKKMTARTYNIPYYFFTDQSLKENPLTFLPVDPKDGFGNMISKFMLKEFRTRSGDTPDNLNDELFWTPRALLILEGSVKRSADPGHWVKKVIADIKNEQASGQDKFVITDLRFKNELYLMSKELKDAFVTCRINRHKDTLSECPSERDLDDVNMEFIIENKGLKDDFLNEVENLATILEGEYL